MHIADVVAGDPHHLYLLCRNRFAEGDELEVLAPHEPSRRLIVRDLHWLNTFGPDNHDEDAPATVEEALTRATTADWEAAAVAASSWKVARAVVPLPLTCPRVPSSANAPSAAPPAMAVRRIS